MRKSGLILGIILALFITALPVSGETLTGRAPVQLPEQDGGFSKDPGGFTVEGDDAELTIDASASSSPKLTFAEAGSLIWEIIVNYSNERLYFYNAEGVVNLSIDQEGGMEHNYQGTGNAFHSSGSTPYAMFWIGNDHEGNSWGLSAGMDSTSAGSSSYGLFGFNDGDGYGVYGRSANAIGTYGLNQTSGNFGQLGAPDYGAYAENSAGHFGYLGGNSYGVYGIYENGAADNYGYLGGLTNAVYGYNGASGNYGYLGSLSYGVYGNLVSAEEGDYAVYGYGTDSSAEVGSSYDRHDTLGGVKGYNLWGNAYTFGVAGYSYLDYNRSGGCFGGKYNGLIWGSMGYQNSGGNEYGGYFTNWTTGSGKSFMSGVGIGAVSDFFGGYVRGEMYGLYAQGNRYAQYNNGDVYTSGCSAVMLDAGEEKRIAAYHPASASVDVYDYGMGTVLEGKADIKFNATFSKLVSTKDSVIVTVTPVGQGAQLYIEEWNSEGFTVADAADFTSNVQFTWIAVGKRKGFENHQPPEELLSAQFDENMNRVTHSDAERSQDAVGIFYQDGEIQYGQPPLDIPSERE